MTMTMTMKMTMKMTMMNNLPRDKRFYECGDWVELLKDKPLKEHPRELFSRFVKESIEDSYRRDYYATLDWFNLEGPDWEDLTEEQRDNIRQEQIRHARDMQSFGNAIAGGDQNEIEQAGRKLAGLE